MTSFLPPGEGWLPSWLLLVSLVSVGNTIQAFITTKNTRQVYLLSASETSALSSRIFGTWTIVSAIIRLYTAYNISNPQVYQLAIWAYVIAWAHFMSEWLVFKTAAWGRGLAGPIIISTGSLIWMLSQWGYYVKG
ncbi:MAG: ergosterol biosynthesis protein [Alectoria fallacina]|uniref:Ergosterol biosynthesis protein n=1 Tax=Alectoria fallacina TaxID=1903189 RepID=A0A8H3G2J1_9LECA|nr:MAG: ergosterol biosynthesis protein [Alectoria fallacina]